MNPAIKQLSNGTWVLKEDTHISRWVETHGTLKCDPCLFQWLQPRLEGCKTVWDVGACIGDHTRFYLDIGMNVVAFEPNPNAYECLYHNCSEATCYNLAASDAHGEIGFCMDLNAGASHLSDKDKTIMVNAVPLDSIAKLGKTPDFIKIDVEGFESKALAGMEQMLREIKPKLFVEFNDGALLRNGTNPEQLKQQIESYGYSKFEIYPPEANPFDPQYDYFCQ